MFTKNILAMLATVVMTSIANAELVPTGYVSFASPPDVQGKPGQRITLKAQLFEKMRDTVTRRFEWVPFAGQPVSFFVNDATPGGYYPVGVIVFTDDQGVAQTMYRIPPRQRTPSTAGYKARFAGSVEQQGIIYRQAISRPGIIRIKR